MKPTRYSTSKILGGVLIEGYRTYEHNTRNAEKTHELSYQAKFNVHKAKFGRKLCEWQNIHALELKPDQSLEKVIRG